MWPFRRDRKEPVVVPPARGVWVYEHHGVLRILLLGNRSLSRKGDGVDPLSFEEFQSVRLRLRRLMNPDATEEDIQDVSVRMYPNYVAFQPLEPGMPDVFTAEFQQRALNELKEILGWEEMPEPQHVLDGDSYFQLNQQHGDRWHMGRYY